MMLLAVLIMGAMGLVGYGAAKGLGLDGKISARFPDGGYVFERGKLWAACG